MNPEIVRRHNRRVPNPTTSYRSPGFYRFRAVCRFAFRLLLEAVAIVVVVGPLIAIWFLMVGLFGDS